MGTILIHFTFKISDLSAAKTNPATEQSIEDGDRVWITSLFYIQSTAYYILLEHTIQYMEGNMLGVLHTTH